MPVILEDLPTPLAPGFALLRAPRGCPSAMPPESLKGCNLGQSKTHLDLLPEFFSATSLCVPDHFTRSGKRKVWFFWGPPNPGSELVIDLRITLNQVGSRGDVSPAPGSSIQRIHPVHQALPYSRAMKPPAGSIWTPKSDSPNPELFRKVPDPAPSNGPR